MKDWNKKKLTALVCAGLMAGTLLPCGIVSAENVILNKVFTDGADLPAGAKWIDSNNGIALDKAGDTLVLDFANEWNKGFYGGYSAGSDTISNYHVVFNSGITDWIYGGYATNGDTKNNTVTMSGGTVALVYGGYSDISGSVTGNTVTISGGTMTQVFGGFSYNSSVTGNTVNLIGIGGTLKDVVTDNQKTPSIASTVYGGFSMGGAVSGNTLNVYGTGTKVGNIANFDTVNFYVPASAMDKDVMLNCTGSEATSLCSTLLRCFRSSLCTKPSLG